VLVPRPSYPLFDFLAGLNDLEIIPYPLAYDDRWCTDLAELTSRLEHADRIPRALVVVHPNNPTGSFVRPSERAAIVELCRRYDLALIADEVFADYALPSNGPRAEDVVRSAGNPEVAGQSSSHAGLNEILTFTLSGLSKVAALPQMKLAWVAVSGPADARNRAIERLEVIADTYLSVSTPVAVALPELLQTRRAIQPQINSRLKENLAEFDSQIESSARVTRLEVEGGWYVVLRVAPAADYHGRFDDQSPGGPSCECNDDEFAAALSLEEGVLVHPGHFYEFTSDGHLVLSLITRRQVFAEGLRKLLRRVNAQYP
jgi:alanine-synthesizing transaminase